MTENLPEYERDVNGEKVSVTGIEHARYIGYDPDNPDHRGQQPVRTIAYSRRSDELYFKAFAPSFGYSTYRFTLKGFNHLVENDFEFGDEISLEEVSEFRKRGFIYTEGEGPSGTDGIEEEREDADSYESNEVEEVNPADVRMQIGQHFAAMIANLAMLQDEWIQVDEIVVEDIDEQLSSDLDYHFERMNELIAVAMMRSRYQH